ncbi:hypothetical protein AB3S75_047763 [Citrus x aurantiifolia]
MYEEIADFFDPNSMTEDAAVAFNGENFNPINPHLIHDPNQVLQYDQSNWDTQQANGQQAPDLFNLLHLSPGCHGLTGHLPSSSIAPPALYDPIFHSNLPSQQPPLFGEFFQSSNYEDGNGGHFNNCVLDEFNGDIGMAFTGTKRVKATGKAKKPIISERQRRVEMNDKFAVLRNLVPNPNNKGDRASVVGDACEYIKELQRSINELKSLVERKRFAREIRSNNERHNIEGCDHDMKPAPLVDPNNTASLRSSWLQRKSKDIEVDVRIVDDEVTVKILQRKKIHNCLLFLSKVFDEMQLDLQHVAGGHIGDYYSFLLNSKIHEGSYVYAGAIVNKLIEVMDRQYAAASIAPINCSN